MSHACDGPESCHSQCCRCGEYGEYSTECATLYHSTFHVAFDSTFQPLAFNLGFDKFDTCHEIAPEAIDLKRRFAFHEPLDLCFIQAGYDDHGFLSSLQR